MRLWLGSSGSMVVIRMVSALAFWIAAAGIEFSHIVDHRENDAVQRVCCQLA